MFSFTRGFLTAGCLFSAGASFGLTVEQAIIKYDDLAKDYNLIAFGNAEIRTYGDTEGGLAIGGNLSIDGGALATHSAENGADPTLYVKGTLSVNGTVQLQSGYAALPTATAGAGWSWNSATDRLSKNGAVALDAVNSSNLKYDATNGSDAPANFNPNWDFAALKTQFAEISTTLANGPVNGSIHVVGQTLTFAKQAGAHGAILFDFDASQLSGNTYNGQVFSNISIAVPDDHNFVVNVRNANGKTIFGIGAGINFNAPAGRERLLWNIADAPNTTADTITFGNGGEFFGSILAPTYLVKNGESTAINGQVVANTFFYSSDELHFTGFYDDLPPVPEPTTYGLIGAIVCVGAIGLRRWRYRK